MTSKLQIRDERGRDRFFTDNELIDGGYGSRLGPYGIAIYVALVRHADYTSQDSWPSYQRLADETGMSRRQAMREVEELCALKMLVKHPRQDDKGDPTSNLYVLTSTKEWSLSGGSDYQSPGVVTTSHQGSDYQSPKGYSSNDTHVEDNGADAVDPDSDFEDFFGPQPERDVVVNPRLVGETVPDYLARRHVERAREAASTVDLPWGAGHAVLDKALGRHVDESALRKLGGFLSEKCGMDPVWQDASSVKAYVDGLHKLYLRTNDDFGLALEAWKRLRGEVTFCDPHGLLKTVESIKQERRKPNVAPTSKASEVAY